MFTIHKAVALDMVDSFKKLKELTFTGIEFYGEHTDFPVEKVIKALGESGLELTSWHVEWRNLQPDTFDNTVSYLKQVKCPIAVVPCLGGKWNVNHTPDEDSFELWEDYVVKLNAINKKLKDNGLRLGYHNHEHELRLVFNGKRVFDILFEGLDSDVILEFDSGNCLESGFDPIQVIKQYADRDVLLHLKPYSSNKGFNVVLGDKNDENDLPGILKANTEKYLHVMVESENSVLPEFENAEKCIEGLRRFW